MANTIDARMLSIMFLSGAMNLKNNKDHINELNVFPVPDGDTGTNMTLTIMSAAKEINLLPDMTMASISKAISSGSLRGARGNSGVILSQLFRGFTKVIRDREELDIVILTAALARATETAYKAVMKPKEGTILTVSRSMAEKAAELTEISDLNLLFDEILKAGDETLARTPDMLPVLKEAGVVDSGGEGLMAILHGAVDAYNGKVIDYNPEETASSVKSEAEDNQKTEAPAYTYCTEFIIQISEPFDGEKEHRFKDFLMAVGDNIVLLPEEKDVKVHVHTNDPGLVLQKALKYGQLIHISLANLNSEEHTEHLFLESEKEEALRRQIRDSQTYEGPTELKKDAFISISIGEGIGSIFRELGVDCLIEGGQTMNPSTEDILRAIEKVHAENVFILPNNKNIILAANQAQLLTKTCRVFVVPTKTIPQGITAYVTYVPEKKPEENVAAMTEEIKNVKTGEVTYAVRDTKVDGKEIRSGDIMGIGDQGILSVGSDVKEVTIELLKNLVDENSELISLYNGADFAPEDAKLLEEMIKEEFPNLDIVSNFGGQPVYYCILSVE